MYYIIIISICVCIVILVAVLSAHIGVDADLEIAPLDTVVMKFSASDLESASGAFTDYFGAEETYSYILENPKSIRHTKPGEETYG